jgi:hypothetical protein
MKTINKYGFKGELQKELEQEILEKKRFKVYDLEKLSDLESKFNSDALGSIAHCETGLKKNQQGLLPMGMGKVWVSGRGLRLRSG